MKISIILKGRIDTNGQQPLQIRINEGATRSFKPTGIKIKPEQWDGQKIVGHPQAKLFNDLLNRHRLKAQVGKLEGEAKYSDADYFAYAHKCMQDWDKTKRPETLRQHQSELNKMRTFYGPKLLLSQITPDFLQRFQAFCYASGNVTNTVWKSFKFIRLILRKAKRERLIEYNPFDIFEMPKYRDPKKTYLTSEQVNHIDAFCKTDECPEALQFAGTWFVIGTYTGLRFSDMAKFDRKKELKGGRLILYTTKTKDLVSMPLSDKLHELFERVQYKPIPYTNTHYNRLLKQLAEILDIEENVSAHLSRHSFAVRCANAGISQEVTAKLMGITNLKTVAIYYKITNPRIDAELGRIFK